MYLFLPQSQCLTIFKKCRPALKRVCIFYCSELPLHPQLCINAALLAGPAIDGEVKVHIGGNFGAEAQFHHAAAAFEAGAGETSRCSGSGGVHVKTHWLLREHIALPSDLQKNHYPVTSPPIALPL